MKTFRHLLRTPLLICLGIFLATRTFAQAPGASIAPIFPVVTSEDVPVRNLPITIYTSDPQPDRFRLVLHSQSTLLVDTNRLSFGGSGTNRTVTLFPSLNKSGTSTLALLLMDGTVLLARRTFTLQVTNENDPPVLNPIPDLSAVLGETLLPLPFNVSDSDGGTYNFTFETSNSALVPTNGLKVTRLALTNYVLSVTPLPGAIGSATILVSVAPTPSAGVAPSSQSLVVTIRPPLFGQSSSTQRSGRGQPLTADFGGPPGLLTWVPGVGMQSNVVFDAQGKPGGTLSLLSQAAVADFNGDGRIDLLLWSSERVQVWINDSTASSHRFSLLTTISLVSLGRITTTLALLDLDQDGDLDLVIGGSGNPPQIYENLGGAQEFRIRSSGITLPGAQFVAGDLDDDGWTDLLLWRSGGNLAGRDGLAQVWRNTGRGDFESMPSRFTIANTVDTSREVMGQSGLADFDGDGLLDVWMTYNSLGRPGIAVHLNHGGGIFELAWQRVIASSNMSSQQLVQIGVSVADFDGDGRPDILMQRQDILTGAGNVTPSQRLFQALIRNLGDGWFADPEFAFAQPLGQVWVGLADVNRDGTIDPVFSRSIDTTLFYTNRSEKLNALPQAPAHLRGIFDGQRVLMQWSAAQDENQTSALTYEVRLGTSPGRGDLLAAHAHPRSGRRLAWLPGNAGFGQALALVPPAAQLQGLRRLYWSVQAIDASLAGGAFAAEAIIDLIPGGDRGEAPTILPVPDVVIASEISLPVRIQFGDDRTPTAQLQVQARIDRPQWISIDNPVRTADGEIWSIRRLTNAVSQAIVTIVVGDGDGNSSSRSFKVTLPARPLAIQRGDIGLLRFEVKNDRSVLLQPDVAISPSYESSTDLLHWEPVQEVMNETGGLLVEPNQVFRFYRQRPK